MLSGETEVQRWEKACPRSSSRSVAELDAELRSLLDLFLSLIPRECCLPLGTAVPGINWVLGSDWPLLICSEMPQWPTHSSQQGCSHFGSYSPIPTQKVRAQACPTACGAFSWLSFMNCWWGRCGTSAQGLTIRDWGANLAVVCLYLSRDRSLASPSPSPSPLMKGQGNEWDSEMCKPVNI